MKQSVPKGHLLLETADISPQAGRTRSDDFGANTEGPQWFHGTSPKGRRWHQIRNNNYSRCGKVSDGNLKHTKFLFLPGLRLGV